MVTEVHLNYEATTRIFKNKRFKQMIHPLNDIYRGNEKAMWHFKLHYGKSTSWVKCEKVSYKVLEHVV